MSFLAFKEVVSKSIKNMAEKIPDFSKEIGHKTESDRNPKLESLDKLGQIEENRKDGAAREEKAFEELKQEFPGEEGYKIEREQYLRDENGNIVKDSVTGEARRIDFVITKDGEVVKTIEVTSESAPKEAQLAKEERIKDEGGVFIRDRDTGELKEISKRSANPI